MATDDELILRILGQATEPLFPSEITDCLNQERRGAYSMIDVVMHLF